MRRRHHEPESRLGLKRRIKDLESRESACSRAIDNLKNALQMRETELRALRDLLKRIASAAQAGSQEIK